MTQQLERRDPTQEDEDEDEDMGDRESSEEDSDSESDDDEGEDEDEEGESEEPDLELRSKIEEALRASGIEPADDSEGGDSEEDEVMDDDQMMAIDDQLAEIFRSRAGEKKGGNGGESPTSLPFIRVDLQLLQMPTPNVRPLTSRTAFSTSWISTSRNNRPAPTSRS